MKNNLMFLVLELQNMISKEEEDIFIDIFVEKKIFFRILW